MASIAPAPLQRYVREVQVLLPAFPGEVRTIDYLPDGTTNLVLRWFGEGHFDVSVRGPIRRAYHKTARALPLAIRIAFRAGGAYPFFGRPISELVDRVVPLDELWGHDAAGVLDAELAATRGDARASAAVLETALLHRLRTRPFEPGSALAARAAAGAIARDDASIAGAADAVGLSQRTLRRAFHAAIGVGPKTFARMMRFQRALAAARGRHRAWAEVARDAGYYDQAHLIAEFRELAGRAPTDAREPARVACGGPR